METNHDIIMVLRAYLDLQLMVERFSLDANSRDNFRNALATVSTVLHEWLEDKQYEVLHPSVTLEYSDNSGDEVLGDNVVITMAPATEPDELEE